MPNKLIDLTGMRFGFLLALDYHGVESRHAMWKCECDCGKILEVAGSNLRAGSTRSCGCMTKELKSSAHRLRAMKRKKVVDLDAHRKKRR